MTDLQTDLFDVGERTPLNDRSRRGFDGKQNTCTPAPVGSGPEGQTCRTCCHYTRSQPGAGVYLKCALMRAHWASGPGTDIKASWPACSSWAGKAAAVDIQTSRSEAA